MFYGPWRHATHGRPWRRRLANALRSASAQPEQEGGAARWVDGWRRGLVAPNRHQRAEVLDEEIHMSDETLHELRRQAREARPLAQLGEQLVAVHHGGSGA
jgi:CHAD domain-containing protein